MLRGDLEWSESSVIGSDPPAALWLVSRLWLWFVACAIFTLYCRINDVHFTALYSKWKAKMASVYIIFR